MAFPAGVAFGIQSFAGNYVKKLTKSKKADRKDLLTSSGDIGVMHWHKVRTEFTVEGSGPMSLDVGAGAVGITGLAGEGQGLDNIDRDEGQEDYTSWKINGIHAEGAVVG